MKYIVQLLSILLLDVLCMIMPIIAYIQTNAFARVILFIIAAALLGLRSNYELWLYKTRNEAQNGEQ